MESGISYGRHFLVDQTLNSPQHKETVRSHIQANWGHNFRRQNRRHSENALQHLNADGQRVSERHQNGMPIL